MKPPLNHHSIQSLKSTQKISEVKSLLSQSIPLHYPLAVTHGNGKWTIYRWFSYSNFHSVRGFSSQPCLMTPEGISQQNPIKLPFSMVFPMVFLHQTSSIVSGRSPRVHSVEVCRPNRGLSIFWDFPSRRTNAFLVPSPEGTSSAWHRERWGSWLY